MAIEYRLRGRNEQTVDALKELGHSTQAECVRRCSDEMLIALQMLHGGTWGVYMDHDAGLVSFSRSLS